MSLPADQRRRILAPVNSDSSAASCSKTPINERKQNGKTIPPTHVPTNCGSGVDS